MARLIDLNPAVLFAILTLLAVPLPARSLLTTTDSVEILGDIEPAEFEKVRPRRPGVRRRHHRPPPLYRSTRGGQRRGRPSRRGEGAREARWRTTPYPRYCLGPSAPHDTLTDERPSGAAFTWPSAPHLTQLLPPARSAPCERPLPLALYGRPRARAAGAQLATPSAISLPGGAGWAGFDFKDGLALFKVRDNQKPPGDRDSSKTTDIRSAVTRRRVRTLRKGIKALVGAHSMMKWRPRGVVVPSFTSRPRPKRGHSARNQRAYLPNRVLEPLYVPSDCHC